jgi:hypothetical protein
MKRVLSILLLGLPLVTGCDAGKEPLARGAAAESAGNHDEARTAYRTVCEKGSPLCPVATRRLERLPLTEAEHALAAGDWKKAHAALDQSSKSSDAGVKKAAEAMAKIGDLEQGLAWEEVSASAAAKPDEALPRIETIAASGTAVAPKAQAWLVQNRPRLLLARVKAACVPGAALSCRDTGRALAQLYPGTPEATEAAALVEADYARVYPVLQQAEGLVGQRVMITDREAKVEACTKEKIASETIHNATDHDDCEREVPSEGIPTDDFLFKAWQKKTAEVHDAGYVKELEAHWSLAAKEGLRDPEAWPKPAAKK